MYYAYQNGFCWQCKQEYDRHEIDFANGDRLRIFRAQCYDTPRGPLQTYHCTAADRVEIVKRSTDRTALEDALRYTDLQQSVHKAICQRLKQLCCHF